MKKGSGSKQGGPTSGTSNGGPQIKPAPTSGKSSPAVTQNLDLSRLDDSGAFDDVETRDAEAASLDAGWHHDLLDGDDAIVEEEAASGARTAEGPIPTAQAELSTRLDVSDAVLEEINLPKHLAAMAAAAAFQPLVEPLFDNQPTQHAPENLRDALRKRAQAADVKTPVAAPDQAAGKATPIANPKPAMPIAAQAAQPKASAGATAQVSDRPQQATGSPRQERPLPDAAQRPAPLAKPAHAAATLILEKASPAATLVLEKADPTAVLAETRHLPAAKPSPPSDAAPANATVRETKVHASKRDHASGLAQKSVANNPTIVAMAPLVPIAVQSETKVALTSADLAVKPVAGTRASPTSSKPNAAAAVPVPASLLKKDVAPARPAGDQRSAETRGAAPLLSGATFVQPPTKETPRTTSAPRVHSATLDAPAVLRRPEAGSGQGGGGRDAHGGGSAPSGSGEPPQEVLRRSIEQRVTQRARDFTLPALLDLLEMLDYRPDEIEFGGVLSYSHPTSLIQSIRFITAPRRMAHVALNMGLLSAQSPLPSYFLKYAEHMDGDALIDFLGFFDHHLLKRRAASLYPERDRTLFADWSEAQAQLLQLVGLTAPSTLYWLFQRVYPELGIEVRRSTERKPLYAEGVVLGNAKLGDACAFGGGTTVPVGGLEVTLYSEEQSTPTGLAWPVEASQRLREQIFAALGEPEVYLTVHLCILEQTSWLAIEDARYLGFEPLWEDLRGDLTQLTLPDAGAGGSSSRVAAQAREAALAARSRASVRIHQVQLFSGPINRGREPVGQLASAIA